MKQKTKTFPQRLRWLIGMPLLGLALACLAGCSAEETDVNGVNGATEKSIDFVLDVPFTENNAAPSTRALTEQDENSIRKMYVLAFKVENASDPTKDTFLYAADGQRGSGSTDGAQKQAWKVKVRINATYRQRFVVVTGAEEEITALLNKYNPGTLKTTMLADLRMTLGAGKGWQTTGSPLAAFPMWGESAPQQIQGIAAPVSLTVSMLRMVARIDVKVDQAAQGKFRLASVRLYNTYPTGQIVPGAGKVNTTGAAKVTAPSIPQGATRQKGPIVYPVNPSEGSTDKAMLRAIYLFETDPPADNKLGGATCLVIGGRYGTDTAETFYRVDFWDKTVTPEKLLPILRNHHYVVTINSVSGAGYGKPEDAFNSRPINMETEVLRWNEVGMNILATDGQYTLAVNKDQYSFTKEAKTAKEDANTLYVWTDHTAGWKVEKRVDAANESQPANWLNLAPASGSANVKAETAITLTENTTTADRKAKIYLAAGRLRKAIEVTQTAAPKVVPKSIKILHVSNGNAELPDNHELVFMPKKSGTHQHIFKVVWEPNTEKMRVSVSGTCSLLDGAPVHGREHNTGEKLYTVTTRNLSTTGANGTSLPQDHLSTVTFTTESGKSQTIKLKQRNYGLIYNNVRPKYASSTSKEYKFEVKSNTTWEIEAVTDGSGVLTAASKTALEKTKGGTANTVTTTPVSFTVAQGKTGKATLRFGNPDGLFADVEVELNVQPSVPAEYGGSNIVWIEDSTKPYGGYLTFSTGPEDKSIDARSQGVFFKWGSLIAISGQGAHGSAFNASSHILFTGEYKTPIANWATIPYADNTTNTGTNTSAFNDSNQNENDFDVYNGGLGYHAEKGVGDICRYISDKGWVEGSWRLPTSAEQEALLNASGKNSHGNWGTPVGNFATIPSTNKNGLFQIPSYVQLSQQWFPTAGARGTDGTLNHVGGNAHYWSGSSYGSYAYGMSVYSHGAGWGYNLNRQCGFSVRCVRE